MVLVQTWANRPKIEDGYSTANYPATGRGDVDSAVSGPAGVTRLGDARCEIPVGAAIVRASCFSTWASGLWAPITAPAPAKFTGAELRKPTHPVSMVLPNTVRVVVQYELSRPLRLSIVAWRYCRGCNQSVLSGVPINCVLPG